MPPFKAFLVIIGPKHLVPLVVPVPIRTITDIVVALANTAREVRVQARLLGRDTTSRIVYEEAVEKVKAVFVQARHQWLRL